MSDLIDTTEMYLRTFYELREEGVPLLRTRVAERLGHSAPTVSQTVARMERDGLLVVGPDRIVELTEDGLRAAVRVMRKHRLAECLLLEVIGLPWERVHAEACRWEHVISQEVEQRLVELLGRPRVSPFGNPIPGMAELGIADAEPGRQPSALADVPPGACTLSRIGEAAQSDRDLLAGLARAGVRPGAVLQVAADGTALVVRGPGGKLSVGPEAARHLFVRSA